MKREINHENFEELNRLAEKVECDLTLVGATAIEDKLQVC
jgi:magnesium-transporting ATPase (P-type)